MEVRLTKQVIGRMLSQLEQKWPETASADPTVPLDLTKVHELAAVLHGLQRGELSAPAENMGFRLAEAELIADYQTLQRTIHAMRADLVRQLRTLQGDVQPELLQRGRTTGGDHPGSA